jgi:LytS/YehU family sensor histidine kinase
MTTSLLTIHLSQSDEGTVAFVLFIALVYLGFRYYKLQGIHKRNQKELMQQLISKTDQIGKLEMDSTRFQLNPHAFKNTLNTVKLLAERTTESIDKLSSVLDYMVYESRANFVSLEKEILFLENFLAFNQLRINETGIIRINNKIDSTHPFFTQPVLPPMITAYFIENSFKHGLLEDKGDLEVTLDIKQNRLFYTVSNPINPIKYKGLGGVGYDNMKRRLEVIFPHRHTMETQVLGSRFVAHLEIELRIRNEEA